MGLLLTTDNFTLLQIDIYNSLATLKRQLLIVYRPFGIGKTKCILAIIAKMQSYLNKPKVLYITNANKAVDNAALRYYNLCKAAGLSKIIIQAHNLKGEQAHLLRFNTRLQLRFDANIPDSLLHEFLAVAYTKKLSNKHNERCARGNPC